MKFFVSKYPFSRHSKLINSLIVVLFSVFTISGSSSSSSSSSTTTMRKVSLRCRGPSAATVDMKLSTGMFESLVDVEELGIYGCRIQELPPSTFRGMNNLQRLVVRDSPIPLRIEPGAFLHLPRLKHLDVSNNRIQVLHPRGVLDPVAGNLLSLNISRNEFPHIYSTNIPQVAARLTKLTSLDLSYNKFPNVLSQAS